MITPLARPIFSAASGPSPSMPPAQRTLVRFRTNFRSSSQVQTVTLLQPLVDQPRLVPLRLQLLQFQFPAQAQFLAPPTTRLLTPRVTECNSSSSAPLIAWEPTSQLLSRAPTTSAWTFAHPNPIVSPHRGFPAVPRTATPTTTSETHRFTTLQFGAPSFLAG